jgi:hypothetical protein
LQGVTAGQGKGVKRAVRFGKVVSVQERVEMGCEDRGIAEYAVDGNDDGKSGVDSKTTVERMMSGRKGRLSCLEHKECIEQN